MAPHSHRECREVGLSKVCLFGIECLHELVDMSRSAVGCHEGVKTVGKGEQSGTVFLAHGNVAESQRGVDGVVEERHALESLLHDTALVDNGKHLLGAFVLIDVHHRAAEACGSPPVDGTVVVAAQVVADVLEVRVVTDTAYALDARLLQVLADGHQLILVEFLIGRIDADIARGSTAVTALNETKAGGDEDEDMAEGVDAPTGGTEREVKSEE